MKALLVVLFVSTFIGSAIASSVEEKIATLFKNYPQTEVSILKNGLKVDLPVHYHQIAGLVLIGTVDLEKTSTLMKKTGLYPMSVTSNSSIAIIYMVDHTANTIGKYQEFVTLIPASKDPNYSLGKFHSYKEILAAFFPSSKDREARKQNDFLFYVPFISVSTEDALLAGREIWNLPKELADFNISFTGVKNEASMKGENCGIEFKQSENHSPKKVPLYMDFNLVGFWNQNYNEIVNAPMLAKGTAYVAPFSSKKGDVFKVDEATECGKWLTESGFKPLVWQYVPRSGAILFKK